MTIYMDSGWMARFSVDIPSGPMGDRFSQRQVDFFPQSKALAAWRFIWSPSPRKPCAGGLGFRINSPNFIQHRRSCGMVSGTLFF